MTTAIRTENTKGKVGPMSYQIRHPAVDLAAGGVEGLEEGSWEGTTFLAQEEQ